ncbi:MAG: alpha/beta fold hydrolase [candidate division KSB1 bacterium]|nr:alpha/beta fold hydrolase [candidate division KSB1 bacterium]
MRRYVLAIRILLLAAALTTLQRAPRASAGDPNKERREQFLQQLLRILPSSPSWEDWLRSTGELPPDFDALESCADLPDPLVRRVGEGEVRVSREMWPARREELKAALQYWILGSTPPPPDELRVEVLREVDLGNALDREVVLHFGPRGTARLWLELLIPEGKGPFPVFLTQNDHRGWALIAVRRGYLACLYAGCDSRDDTDTFLPEYPDEDWSRLTRRAWAASRCLDYLETVPEADTARIAITGHSRNGKQALIAAALDERIDLVISSSSGAGGAATARYVSEQHFGEGIELITRRFPEWYHPRWRFFVGREHKLPVDLHDLVALIAPRPCLLSVALNDAVESVWGIQQTYLAVKPVYEMLGAPDRLRILWREGSHETTGWLIERYLDWCDHHFGRARYEFPEEFLYPASWQEWLQLSRASVDLEKFPRREFGNVLEGKDGHPVPSWSQWVERKQTIRQAVSMILGEEPACVPSAGGLYGLEPDYVASLLRRSSPSSTPGLTTWLLSASDLQDPAGLLNELRAGKTAVARRIWKATTSGWRKQVQRLGMEGGASLPNLLVEQLNRVLISDSLYALVEGGRSVLSRGIAGPPPAPGDLAARVRANRIVLEEAFPQHIYRALVKRQIVFGEYLNGDLVYPAAAEAFGRRIPVIVWLHPLSPASGYVAGYMRGEQPFRRLARAGFAVFCYDQIGCGRRIREATGFYERHPRWSLLGKMVRDAGAALSVLGRFDVADTNRVWVLGYGTGSLIALHLAAFDDRPCGWVLVCPPAPYRLDTDARETGGIARWSHRTLLLPQLGFFVGQEERVPYDLHELLACMAPRPVLVVNPQLDREAPPDALRRAVEAARPVFDLAEASDRLVLLTPEDYNNFASGMQELVVGWLREHAF